MPAGALRATHWDFMVESASALRTWALACEPVADEAIPAMSLADHRLAYLEYEGPISGDRGNVSRWDQGVCRLLDSEPDQCRIELGGHRLRGLALLVRASEPDHWTFRLSSGKVATPV